jgi:hypothetical protein
MVVLVLNAAEQPWLSPPDQLVPAQLGDVMAVTRLVVTVPVAPLDDVTLDTDLPRPEMENNWNRMIKIICKHLKRDILKIFLKIQVVNLNKVAFLNDEKSLQHLIFYSDGLFVISLPLAILWFSSCFHLWL